LFYARLPLGWDTAKRARWTRVSGAGGENDDYLFEDKLWMDADEYAVVRVEGHPAKKLSREIQRADFVRKYQKIDRFWLSEKDPTFVQIRPRRFGSTEKRYGRLCIKTIC